MNYLKNIEICKLYGVSPATPVRWIKQARLGKNELTLVEVKGKTRIINETVNHVLMERMAKEGEKFISQVNQGETIKISPLDIFYEVFNQDEIGEIVIDLKNDSRTKLQFSYDGLGAKYYHDVHTKSGSPDRDYVGQALDEVSTNLVELAKNKQQKINLIDLGCGNGLLAQPLLKKFINKDCLEEYLAIDISQKLLDTCEQAQKDLFGSDLKIKKLEINIISDDINREIVKLNLIPKTKNIYLLIDAIGVDDTFDFKYLENLANIINPDDVIIFDFWLNLEYSAYPKIGAAHPLSKKWLLAVLEMLGIKNEMLETKIIYDENKKQRYQLAYPKQDLDFEVNVFNQKQSILLKKENPIKVWSWKMLTLDELYTGLNSSGLLPISLKLDKEIGMGLAVCQPIKGMKFA